MFEPIPKCFEGQTKDECIYKCKIEHFINKTGTYPNSLMCDQRNSNKKFWRNVYLKFDVSDTECRRSCNQMTECYKEYFVMNSQFVSYHPSAKSDPTVHQVIIEYPAQPSLVYELNLKMHFEEYLCLLSSILSLWFGISFVMFTDFCSIIFLKLKDYFSPLVKVDPLAFSPKKDPAHLY